MKIKSPFFSIVTGTYNSEKYIGQNIKSVTEQTFGDYEHIIVDGQSNDSTPLIINEAVKKHLKLSVFSFPPKGISNALNEGIYKSSGKYIIHLNSDDQFYDNKILELVHAKIKANNFPDVVYGKICTIEDDGKIIGFFPRQKLLQLASPSLLKYINYVPHQAVFIKKTVFDKFGTFDETLTSSMDYDLWLKIIGKTRWMFIDYVISKYRVRKGSQSSDKKNREKNLKNSALVLHRYLSPIEIKISEFINFLLSTKYKMYR